MYSLNNTRTVCWKFSSPIVSKWNGSSLIETLGCANSWQVLSFLPISVTKFDCNSWGSNVPDETLFASWRCCDWSESRAKTSSDFFLLMRSSWRKHFLASFIFFAKRWSVALPDLSVGEKVKKIPVCYTIKCN